MKFFKALTLILVVALLAVFAGGCGSSEYPGKNINVTIQYSPGGPTDMSVRGLLDTAGKNLPSGVSFIPANKTGGGGLIGMTETANAKTDGYNIGVISVDVLMHHYLGKTDLTLENFDPIACTMADPYGLVIKADAPYQTVDEFIEYARANPGVVTVGNSAAGGAPHLAALAFEKAFDLSFTHVSYDGSAECITAIAGGHLDATFTQPSPAKAQMDAGELKMIGILDEKRMASFPDVPMVSETQEIDFNMRGWVVVAAPKGLDEKQLAYLRELFLGAVQTEEYAQVITNLGMQPIAMTLEQVETMLKEDDVFYKELCADIELG